MTTKLRILCQICLMSHSKLSKLSRIHVSFYSSRPSNNPSVPYRGRRRTKSKHNRKPSLNEAQFHHSVMQLPPRFGPEELFSVLNLQEDPIVSLELFNWASQQNRFNHDVSTYHITIKKLGAAQLYEEMDTVVNQVLALRDFGSEALYNTIIYYFTEARKLTRAVNIFKHMRNSNNAKCKPSIRTYNILFAAFVSRGKNSYISHMYMGTSRSLFKQMIGDGIEPDIFSLNAMIKGYVLSLHLNDALRIFHQMGVVYATHPNSHSYNYLIHGLCAQGRTNNAIELSNQMKEKGYIPGSKAFNSLVNALALVGEVDKAVGILWEMTANRRVPNFITYRTVLDEYCRQGRVELAMKFLRELQEKNLVDGHAYGKLLHWIEDEYGDFSGKD